DLFLAFATGNGGLGAGPTGPGAKPEMSVRMLDDRHITPLFDAAAEATEAAIVNALLAATTTTGRDDIVAHALPHDRLLEALGAG
ncbi:MAG: P1 family peptidase, partial [Thermoleophilia bacterium]|nr:P1 family peptidase [Thermoleophilia bacterium]